MGHAVLTEIQVMAHTVLVLDHIPCHTAQRRLKTITKCALIEQRMKPVHKCKDHKKPSQ